MAQSEKLQWTLETALDYRDSLRLALINRLASETTYQETNTESQSRLCFLMIWLPIVNRISDRSSGCCAMLLKQIHFISVTVKLMTSGSTVTDVALNSMEVKL